MTRLSVPIRRWHAPAVLVLCALASAGSAQSRTGAAALSQDHAAAAAAASVAMGEACDFSAAELEKMKTSLAPGADVARPGEFDAAVARHMPNARSQVAAQRQQAGAAWSRNCESARLFLQQ